MGQQSNCWPIKTGLLADPHAERLA